MCNWPKNDWQHKTEFKKINSTCSQRISCAWWSEVEALSPVFRLSSPLSWPLKFLYWCWVINSHQRAILLLILSSWALIRAKPRLWHAPGILALGDWDLKMWGYLWVSFLPLPWSGSMESYNCFYLLGTFMHQENSVFSNFWLWTHHT